MISDNCPAELRNIVVEVNQVFGLFVRLDIIEMDVFVAPFKVVDYSLICQFLFHYEDILKEINDSLLDVKVVEFCYHGLLVLQVLLICIYKRIPFIYYTSYIVKY
jgi:hypothetical protein